MGGRDFCGTILGKSEEPRSSLLGRRKLKCRLKRQGWGTNGIKSLCSVILWHEISTGFFIQSLNWEGLGKPQCGLLGSFPLTRLK